MATRNSLPLPVLVSRVLGYLRNAVEDEEKATRSPVPSLPMWSNLVRCVAECGPDGITERELPETARISSRLATAAVTAAARYGWISSEAGSAGTRNRQLRLTDDGRRAAPIWTERLTALDETWNAEPLRAALEALVARVPFELPHFPASYGAADPSAVGGPFVQHARKDDGVPAHGNDWKPVMRGDGDTVSPLPITALLSQTLMAFTIDYEDRFPWPLASTATVLCHLSTEPRRIGDLPVGHGIKGNGKSLLERHLIVSVTKDPRDPRTKLVALTDRGAAVISHHPARLEAVEAEWRRRHGDAVVTDLRAALSPAADAAGAQPDHVTWSLV